MLQFSQSLNRFLQDEKTPEKRFFKKEKKSITKEKVHLPPKPLAYHIGGTINFSA
ncbi:hypothetical protein MJH12_19635 [bacterium]|nr:hypothetical protein [bacterium]